MTDFNPANVLEHALVRATSDPAAEEDFYRALLASDLFIIDETPPPPHPVQGVLEAGSDLQIAHYEIDGTPHVPVFSSLARLQANLTGEKKFIQANGRALLEIFQGAHVILNPGHAFGKQLVPDEIGALLDGTIFRPGRQIVFERDTSVLLGQPAEYPTQLVDILTPILSSQKSVRAAYLGQIAIPSQELAPHVVVGIDTSGDYKTLLRLVFNGLGQKLPRTAIVDFVPMDDSTIAKYLRTTQPFYKKKLLGIF